MGTLHNPSRSNRVWDSFLNRHIEPGETVQLGSRDHYDNQNVVRGRLLINPEGVDACPVPQPAESQRMVATFVTADAVPSDDDIDLDFSKPVSAPKLAPVKSGKSGRK